VLQPVEPVAPPEMAQGYAPELEEQKKPAHARRSHCGWFAWAKRHSELPVGKRSGIRCSPCQMLR
jgi:hypothetical protein